MILSDFSVKRPVFATVASVLLVTFGGIAYTMLPLRELPDIEFPVVSLNTSYRGASAAVIDTRITEVLEERISGIEGIETITSASRDGRSGISIEFGLTRDVDDAINDVRDAISRIAGNLPDGADAPETRKASAGGRSSIWYNVMSTEFDSLELAEFARRQVEDQLSVVDGVAGVSVSGPQAAMRVWIDRPALAARGLTALDIENALRAENVELPGGTIESSEREFTVRIPRAYSSARDFANLVLARGPDGHLIRLGEVAEVERGATEPDYFFEGNGVPMVGMGVLKQSKANLLTMVEGTDAAVANLNRTLPEHMSIVKNYDESVYVDAALREVYRTLAIAVFLVVIVIYVFLGTARAALVPAATVPVCLIATCIVLVVVDASLNLMTLLALVLSIGLVVDDSIVVLENIQRRVELGETPIVAAFRGARQVGFAVVATTLVLISVFVPLVFVGGSIGRLFSELAIAISAAVGFSSLVALTLSVMLCSKLLRPGAERRGAFARSTHATFGRLAALYQRALPAVIDRPGATAALLVGVVAGLWLLMEALPGELAPDEDRGSFFVQVTGPEGGGFEGTMREVKKVQAILMEYVERGDEVDRVLARAPGWGGRSNAGTVIVSLKHWDERDRSGLDLLQEVNDRLHQIPGVRAFGVMRQGLRTGSGRTPIEFVIGGSDFDTLARWRDIVLARAEENPRLTNLDSDYKETQPQLKVEVDRDRAADLGVSVQTIGHTLETLLGGRRVTTYLDAGEERDVILQLRERDRRRPGDLENIFVRSQRTGQLLPLSNLVALREVADSSTLNRYNRARSITISGSLEPGYQLGEALEYLEGVVRSELPETARIDYKGQSREFREASGSLYFTFAVALLVVFLVLAAQFESFIHPLVIMLTVPLGIGGALLGLYAAGSSLNIYSQIGIIILVGLAAKNGILIVEFANQLRDEGRDLREALLEASATRFRPIVMTGLSTSMGAIPLVLATGAGSSGRHTIGVVIFSGVLVATAFTLFVVPVFYNLLGRYTRSPSHVARRLEEEARLGTAA